MGERGLTRCACALLVLAGCGALRPGPGGEDPRELAAASGAIVAGYPAAVIGCLELSETRGGRRACVETARAIEAGARAAFDRVVDEAVARSPETVGEGGVGSPVAP